MPAYHSSFTGSRTIGNFAIVPIKTKVRGPAPPTTEEDIVDEAINLFRANSFFRNFEVKSPEDRVLIYLTLFIQECLTKLALKPVNLTDATRTLQNWAVINFSIPGDANFPLNALYEKPTQRGDADTLRQYISQLRQETAIRFSERCYYESSDKPSKWWMMFSKRKFMGITSISGC